MINTSFSRGSSKVTLCTKVMPWENKKHHVALIRESVARRSIMAGSHGYKVFAPSSSNISSNEEVYSNPVRV
jgi:hypothetical protein